MLDLAVIGGGAAGLCAAICAKRRLPQQNIAVLEALDRVGKKLITTGNGQCNITNRKAELSRYHGQDLDFCQRVFNRYFVEEAEVFFDSIGVPLVFESDGRAYPASYQAGSVVDALRFTAEELGIELRCSCRVMDLSRSGMRFRLKTEQGMEEARAVILTSGLLSGGPKAGSDGSVFQLLKQKGLKTVRLTPAIVQVKTETAVTRQLKGIKLDANAAIVNGSRLLRQEYGEVLFTEYGLSGPPILQLSRFAEREPGKLVIRLDLQPQQSLQELTTRLMKRRDLLARRKTEEFLTGLIHKRVGQVLLKTVGCPLAEPAAGIREDQLKALASLMKDWRFPVVGTTGFGNSQVTAGGIATGEFDPADLQCHRIRGLFAAGELLDVDGDCGGFNLQWAWSSGMLAAEGACRYLEGKR